MTSPPAGQEVRTIAGCFLAYGTIFFDRLGPLFLVALIAADLGVPSAGEGALALLVGLGWAAAMPVVRATTGRWRDRHRIVAALALGGLVGLCSALAGSWVGFVVLRGVGGLAVATGSPAVTALAFSVTPARRRGSNLGLIQSSTRLLGSLAAPVIVTSLAVQHGWRAAVAGSGVLLLVVAVVVALTVPPSATAARRSRQVAAFRLRPGGRRDLALCTVACVLLLAWLTVYSQSAVVLVSDWLAITIDDAGPVVGSFGFGAAVSALLVPIVSDRVGRRPALAAAAGLGGVAGAAVSGMIASGHAAPVWLAVTLLAVGGAAMGALPLVISIVPAETVVSGDVGRALIAPIAGGEALGAAVLPMAAAWVAPRLGGAEVLGASAVAVVSVAVLSRWLGRPAAAGAADQSTKSSAIPT